MIREVINELKKYTIGKKNAQKTEISVLALNRLIFALEEQETKWIPVSEGPPDNTDPVNITWVNHDPEPYYADIKDKPFTATGCYCNGKWYWYSVTCQDYLDEYGFCNVDAMDEAIEVIAWMPLPKPFKADMLSPKFTATKFTATNYKVDTLKFQRSYPEALIAKGDEDEIRNIIIRDLVDSLVSQMGKYVIITTCFDPYSFCYKFAGEVKVVRTESEETAG